MLPVLSVLIPTYNRREIVARCLKSLAEQTLPPEQYEVIVIDDGSTDGTDEMLASLDYPASLRWKKFPHGPFRCQEQRLGDGKR